MPKARKHVIEGMSKKNIRYALANNMGRSYVFQVNSNGTGARVYERGTKVTPEHGGKYYMGDAVAKIEKSGGEYKLIPGDKKPRYSANKFLDNFERGLERKCTEYNREHSVHHKRPARRKKHKSWGL